jgi:hypothetical protein
MSQLKRVPASDALEAGDCRRLDSSLGESPARQARAPPSPETQRAWSDRATPIELPPSEPVLQTG